MDEPHYVINKATGQWLRRFFLQSDYLHVETGGVKDAICFKDGYQAGALRDLLDHMGYDFDIVPVDKPA